MSPRPAAFTQTDVERAIRAARSAGAAEVEVRGNNGSAIVIRLKPSTPPEDAIEQTGEIVL